MGKNAKLVSRLAFAGFVKENLQLVELAGDFDINNKD